MLLMLLFLSDKYESTVSCMRSLGPLHSLKLVVAVSSSGAFLSRARCELVSTLLARRLLTSAAAASCYTLLLVHTLLGCTLMKGLTQ
jgi:hypothetical protein